MSATCLTSYWEAGTHLSSYSAAKNTARDVRVNPLHGGACLSRTQVTDLRVCGYNVRKTLPTHTHTHTHTHTELYDSQMAATRTFKVVLVQPPQLPPPSFFSVLFRLVFHLHSPHSSPWGPSPPPHPPIFIHTLPLLPYLSLFLPSPLPVQAAAALIRQCEQLAELLIGGLHQACMCVRVCAWVCVSVCVFLWGGGFLLQSNWAQSKGHGGGEEMMAWQDILQLDDVWCKMLLLQNWCSTCDNVQDANRRNSDTQNTLAHRTHSCLHSDSLPVAYIPLLSWNNHTQTRKQACPTVS